MQHSRRWRVMQTLLDILKRAGGWNPGLYSQDRERAL